MRLVDWTGQRLAAFSFTLYVVHVPVLGLMRALYPPLTTGQLSPDDPSHMLVYAVMLGGIVLAAYLFHLPFEAQTNRLRKLIKRLRSAPAIGRSVTSPLRGMENKKSSYDHS